MKNPNINQQTPTPQERPVGTSWIEHHPSYFSTRPPKSPEITLLFWWCRQFKHSVRRKADCVSFYGVTQDEAERKMVTWIEQHQAIERDPGGAA